MKFRRVLFFSIFFVSVMLSIPEIKAQRGSMSGEVLDEQGNPVADVLIRIEGMHPNRRKYQSKTGNNGRWARGGITFQGAYYVAAVKDGYQSMYFEGQQPTFGAQDHDKTRGIVNFVLKEGESGVLGFEMSDEERAAIVKRNEEMEKLSEEDKQNSAIVHAAANRGLRFFSQGMYQEALESFKEGLEADPRQYPLWARLGSTYTKLEQHDEAIEAYEKAVALSPEDPSLYQNLGNSYAAKGETEKARVAFDKGASLSSLIDPTAAATNYYNMGVTFINSGRTQEAIEALTKALESDPAHADAHYQMGISLLGVNQIEKSVEHLRKYMELKPDGPDVATAEQLISTFNQ